MTSPSAIPKAVLYYSPESVWSTAVLLMLQEKGYGDNEVDKRVVDTSKGEEFAPSFLRLNAKATVPTLVVPFQASLASDMETRFKALSHPKAILELLDKSRSATSRTHTTSSAPAPSLSPATIAFSRLSQTLIDATHAEAVSPDALRYYNARDPASFRALLPMLQSRRNAIEKHLADSSGAAAVPMSEKTNAFWMEKKQEIEILLKASTEEETWQAYLRLAKEIWEVSVPDTLTRVDKEMIGPYSLGDHISVADLHLGVWMARIVKLSGGTLEDSGEEALQKVERRVGSGFTLPKDRLNCSKLVVFWDAMRERASWQKVYATGLV